MRINIGSVETIIHDEFSFTKFSAHWVPKLLSDEQKETSTNFSSAPGLL